MKSNTYIIGKRIKEQRKKLGLTQTEIKSAVGISSGNLSDIENGNRLPAAATLIQLASVLQCSIDWMLTGILPASEIPSSKDPNETILLESYRKLPNEEKEELMEIVQIILRKTEKREKQKGKYRGTNAGKIRNKNKPGKQ